MFHASHGRAQTYDHLQEVVRSPARDHGFSSSRAWVELQAVWVLVWYTNDADEDLQGILEVLIDLHDGSLVPASVAVVGCCGY
jgi:hypothetical protein